MKYSEILNRLQELKEEKPVEKREPPTEHKQSAFRQAWFGKGISRLNPNNLTWKSLGYEMGKYFKTQDPEDIDYVYRILADEYSKNNRE